jgi:uncharacterized protein (TIGR02594 family)
VFGWEDNVPGTDIALPALPKPLLFALGELQRGVREIAGAAADERISMYLATVGQGKSDEIPWCSAFVSWCVEQAGFASTGMANARSWLLWGKKVITPQLGDVAVFRRGTGWQGHVGFVLDANHGLVTLLGGNQSDRVCVSHYGVADLLEYRRAV